jgi:deoxyribonuclease-4
MRIGLHVSIAGSLDKSVGRAKELGCNTFQLFTRNPRGWSFSGIPEGTIASFREKILVSGISPVIDHMPYLPNLASPNDEVYKRSVDTLKAELDRCQQLGIPYLVTHLGSHLGSGAESGIQRLTSALNDALGSVNSNCIVLLENTAGQKNSFGTTFENIRDIMDKVSLHGRVGLCLDTCHAYAAGYDIKKSAGEVLDNLSSTLGIERLKVVHLNDSKGPLGSHLDRHEHIGLGEIGEAGFRSMLGDQHIRSLPLIMETPVDSRRDDLGNMKKLCELAGEVPPTS